MSIWWKMQGRKDTWKMTLITVKSVTKSQGQEDAGKKHTIGSIWFWEAESTSTFEDLLSMCEGEFSQNYAGPIRAS